MIEKLGGKLTGSANKASLCISTKSKFDGRVPLRGGEGSVAQLGSDSCHCSLKVKLVFVLYSVCSHRLMVPVTISLHCSVFMDDPGFLCRQAEVTTLWSGDGFQTHIYIKTVLLSVMVWA